MASPKEYAEARRDATRRRRTRRWVLLGTVSTTVLVLGALVWLFLFSAVYEAREIVVQGNSLLTKQQVEHAAKVTLRVPLLRVDTRSPENRLEALPEVRDARVDIDFPNTVRITVQERTPVYQLRQGETYQWVDAQGVAFRKEQPRRDGLPEVSVGKVDPRWLKDVATVVVGLPEGVRGKVEHITARSVDRIEIALDDERRIIWGSAEQTELKANVIDALLHVKAKIYDVSAPEHPTTR